jgi:hypothetical protein
MKLEPAPVRYSREPRAREGRRWGKNRKLENNAFPTKDTALIGAAGVHFVVSELSLRGLIALPTIRNTAGVDVLVTDKKGTW